MQESAGVSNYGFDRLLAWLDPDSRERAGERYEALRRRLVYFFRSRQGGSVAEDLADQSLTIVERKLAQGEPIEQASPEAYLHGVAKYILLQYQRRPRTEPLPLDILAESANREKELQLRCLDQCLADLPAKSRHLIQEYYQGTGQERMERRRELAVQFNVSPNALGVRAHRLRSELERCLQRCLSR